MRLQIERSITAVIRAVFFFAVTAATLSAQADRGVITGLVLDQQGASLPRTQVITARRL